MNENPQRPQMTTADSSSHPSHPPHNAHVILVVDDALDSLRMLCDALAAEGYVVLAARDATGLQIPSVVIATHWAKPLSDPNPATRQIGLDGLLHGLRDAKAYGASSVLLVPGTVTKQVSYTEAFTRSAAEISSRQSLPACGTMVARPMLMVRLEPSAGVLCGIFSAATVWRSFSANSRAPPGEVFGSTSTNSSPP